MAFLPHFPHLFLCLVEPCLSPTFLHMHSPLCLRCRYSSNFVANTPNVRYLWLIEFAVAIFGVCVGVTIMWAHVSHDNKIRTLMELNRATQRCVPLHCLYAAALSCWTAIAPLRLRGRCCARVLCLKSPAHKRPWMPPSVCLRSSATPPPNTRTHDAHTCVSSPTHLSSNAQRFIVSYVCHELRNPLHILKAAVTDFVTKAAEMRAQAEEKANSAEQKYRELVDQHRRAVLNQQQSPQHTAMVITDPRLLGLHHGSSQTIDSTASDNNSSTQSMMPVLMVGSPQKSARAGRLAPLVRGGGGGGSGGGSGSPAVVAASPRPSPMAHQPPMSPVVGARAQAGTRCVACVSSTWPCARVVWVQFFSWFLHEWGV